MIGEIQTDYEVFYIYTLFLPVGDFVYMFQISVDATLNQKGKPEATIWADARIPIRNNERKWRQTLRWEL